MNCPGAPARRGRPLAQLDWPTAKFVARGVVPRPQPCLRTHGLAMPARRSRLVARVAARVEAVAHKRSLQKQSMARLPASTRDSSLGDGSTPSALPLFSSPHGGAHMKGGNPKRVGGLPARDGLGRKVYALGQGGARAKDATTHQDWVPGRDWLCGRLPLVATVPVASPVGAKGAFPQWTSPLRGLARRGTARRARLPTPGCPITRTSTVSAGRRGRRGGKR
jgi:hypothetical protein